MTCVSFSYYCVQWHFHLGASLLNSWAVLPGQQGQLSEETVLFHSDAAKLDNQPFFVRAEQQTSGILYLLNRKTAQHTAFLRTKLKI